MVSFATVGCLFTLLIPAVVGYNGDPYSGIVLYAEKTGIRSGVLSADHRCQSYPVQFPTHEIANAGRGGCSLWTEEDCQGSLYVVPSHYAIQPPNGVTFKSVICSK
ncbi:hypothetical protein DM01DRAFT_1160870 [Hesseltinella vesiculosa]|uniref:Uncharacterized protein n=1 Tax=Hesseltinella vesiculosa TaxID=101127 RepID=A0A1X2GSG3_9FUNG|nr:hypothetical protein DM01DRAFT_1160870 [Hesseltinella vesiculosa]